MRKNLLGLALSVGLLVLSQPAQAQYTGGLPYSSGTFYPMGAMMGSPFSSYARYGMGGMGAASTGMWYGGMMGMGLLRAALFYGTTHLNGNHTSVLPEDYQSKKKKKCSNGQTPSNGSNAETPADGSDAQTASNASYQDVHAQWLPAPNQPAVMPVSQQQSMPQASRQQPAADTGVYAAGPYSSALAEPERSYPSAPELEPNRSAASAAPSMVSNIDTVITEDRQVAENTPLAAGLVDLVNHKYNGNMSTALGDPEVQSWSKALGLTNGSQVYLSHTRIKVIEDVLKDYSLDPVTKIEAIKALMHT